MKMSTIYQHRLRPILLRLNQLSTRLRHLWWHLCQHHLNSLRINLPLLLSSLFISLPLPFNLLLPHNLLLSNLFINLPLHLSNQYISLPLPLNLLLSNLSINLLLPLDLLLNSLFIDLALPLHLQLFLNSLFISLRLSRPLHLHLPQHLHRCLDPYLSQFINLPPLHL